MYKVILVEDEIYARQGLRDLINWERLGYEVAEEAGDGEEALRIIADTKPDLVITDIRMPVLDGLELIRTVRDSGNHETKFIIISGYGDFKYAQQAIKFGVKDFILKPIDEDELMDSLTRLAVQINKDKMKLEERAGYSLKALARLLRGEAAEEELRGIADLLDLQLSGRYGYLIVEINDLPKPGAGANAAKDQIQQFRQLIAQTAAELGFAADQQLHLHEHRYGVYGFPFKISFHTGKSEREDKARKLAERLSGQLAFPVLAYLGTEVDRLADINNSYAAAMELMDYKYAYAGRQLLSYDQIGAGGLRYIEFEAADYARLMEQLEEGNLEAMHASVDWIFEVIQQKAFAPEAVQNAVARFVFAVIGSIRAMQGDENELQSLEPVMQWPNQPVTLQGLKERLSAFMEESALMAAGLRKKNTRSDMMRIKSYIEQHYSEDISLKSIAASFYMNPAYLGQLFRKTFGLYFNDFLLQIRIDNAKRLLRQTEMRVYEIARCVGFDNADYFVSKFEKVEGKTPTAYRNKLLPK
ncbi:response regulator [Paenibacillus protaetiae]|uniref:Response regulator transcription factor n=1 Tax=Paenibacillus protaetiae TaxID=2509456 RepID=A0A4P6EXR2_9BACL|nr:response regulator [Paenibacillus protaetiae]QAY67586.1 response regulator transcription factor [Paenibacillus protaetiae]